MNQIVKEIRKKQDEIIVMINSAFDEIVEKAMQLNEIDAWGDNEYEVTYPLTNTSGFKGKKVIAVVLNGKRNIARTWKQAVRIILENAMQDEDKKNKMYNLRDKILGRTRNRLSLSSKDMRSPLELGKDLYIETHYDTETLMNLLLQILNEISYDYSKVRIVIKN